MLDNETNIILQPFPEPQMESIAPLNMTILPCGALQAEYSYAVYWHKLISILLLTRNNSLIFEDLSVVPVLKIECCV
jgi:hypothetical protein